LPKLFTNIVYSIPKILREYPRCLIFSSSRSSQISKTMLIMST